MEEGGFFHALLQDEAGVTAIEYALLASLIAVAIVGAVTTVGLNLGVLYDMVATEVSDAISGV